VRHSVLVGRRCGAILHSSLALARIAPPARGLAHPNASTHFAPALPWPCLQIRELITHQRSLLAADGRQAITVMAGYDLAH
jgi:hypothetical protein